MNEVPVITGKKDPVLPGIAIVEFRQAFRAIMTASIVENNREIQGELVCMDASLLVARAGYENLVCSRRDVAEV